MDWSIYRLGGERTFVPPGYCYMPQIAEAIGKAVHGEEWVGNECAFDPSMLAVSVCAPEDAFSAPEGAPDGFLASKYAAAVRFWSGSKEPFPDITQPTWSEWTEAYGRWRHCFEFALEIGQRKRAACVAIQKAAVMGTLPFVVRAPDGAWLDVPARYWNCDDAIAMARIALGRLDMAQPMRVPDFSDRSWIARQRDWLFVPSDALHTVSEGLARLRRPAIEAEPEEQPAGPVVATAAAIAECKTWLRGEFEKKETATRHKSEFRDEALVRYAGRMSKRGFDGAWDEVAKDFPSRTKRGPRAGD